MSYAAGWNGTQMPKMPNIQKIEPIYSNLFEIHYSCVDLTTNECEILTNNTHKINNNTLCIHVNEDDDGGVEIMRILKKMNTFSLNVILHNRMGKNIAIILFKNCKFVDFIRDFCNLDWEESDILKPKFNFTCESTEYIDYTEFQNYKRRIKLERIVKED
jgi:hypothetical protein